MALSWCVHAHCVRWRVRAKVQISEQCCEPCMIARGECADCTAFCWTLQQAQLKEVVLNPSSQCTVTPVFVCNHTVHLRKCFMQGRAVFVGHSDIASVRVVQEGRTWRRSTADTIALFITPPICQATPVGRPPPWPHNRDSMHLSLHSSLQLTVQQDG
jgi:hypothetical protein